MLDTLPRCKLISINKNGNDHGSFKSQIIKLIKKTKMTFQSITKVKIIKDTRETCNFGEHRR